MECLTTEQAAWHERDRALKKKWGIAPEANRVDRVFSLFRRLDVDEQLRHLIEGLRVGTIALFEDMQEEVDVEANGGVPF